MVWRSVYTILRTGRREGDREAGYGVRIASPSGCIMRSTSIFAELDPLSGLVLTNRLRDGPLDGPTIALIDGKHPEVLLMTECEKCCRSSIWTLLFNIQPQTDMPI